MNLTITSLFDDEADASETINPSRSAFYPLFWISLAALPIFLWGLSAPGLNDAEGMYAEIAREMRLGGDWITPHLNGTRHFDKPPLLYWLIALTQMVLGETETAARFWPSLATWATIPVIGALGDALFGRRAGRLSAVVCATGLGAFIFGRIILPDPSMCFWVSLSVLGYVKGYLRGDGKGGVWTWVMFGAMGAASLIKGILGLGFPAAIIGLHVLWTGRLRSMFSLRSFAGICLTAAVALPWQILVGRANPDFFGYFILREHFMRFTGKRFPPDEFLSLPVFLTFTYLWTFPWIAIVPQAVKRSIDRVRNAFRRSDEDLLLLLWIGIVVGLFSASQSRLEYYAFTSLPAFALLVGKLWDDTFTSESDIMGGKGMLPAMAVMTSLAAAAAVGAFIILGPSKDLVFQTVNAYWPESGWIPGPEQAQILERIRIPSILTMAGIALFSLAALIFLKRRNPRGAFITLTVMMIPLFFLVHWGFMVMEPFMSARAVADLVVRNTRPDSVVVLQEPHEYMWVGGVVFYAKRPINILKDPKFEGVASRRREPPERFLDRETFLSLWNSKTHVVLIADEDFGLIQDLDFSGTALTVGETGGRTVLENRR